MNEFPPPPESLIHPESLTLVKDFEGQNLVPFIKFSEEPDEYARGLSPRGSTFAETLYRKMFQRCHGNYQDLRTVFNQAQEMLKETKKPDRNINIYRHIIFTSLIYKLNADARVAAHINLAQKYGYYPVEDFEDLDINQIYGEATEFRKDFPIEDDDFNIDDYRHRVENLSSVIDTYSRELLIPTPDGPSSVPEILFTKRMLLNPRQMVRYVTRYFSNLLASPEPTGFLPPPESLPYCIQNITLPGEERLSGPTVTPEPATPSAAPALEPPSQERFKNKLYLQSTEILGRAKPLLEIVWKEDLREPGETPNPEVVAMAQEKFARGSDERNQALEIVFRSLSSANKAENMNLTPDEFMQWRLKMLDLRLVMLITEFNGNIPDIIRQAYRYDDIYRHWILDPSNPQILAAIKSISGKRRQELSDAANNVSDSYQNHFTRDWRGINPLVAKHLGGDRF